jgi:hypothetical protein
MNRKSGYDSISIQNRQSLLASDAYVFISNPLL